MSSFNDRLLHSRVWDVLFPPRCVSCEQHGSWWCTSCQDSVEMLLFPLCRQCLQVARNHDCSEKDSPCEAVWATGYYHDHRLRSSITALKYRGATCLLPSIATYLQRWKKSVVEPWPWAGDAALAIQPIPTLPARERERGFDHAELIANAVRESLVPWAGSIHLLARRREEGLAQATIETAHLRVANAMDQFVYVGKGDPPASVLLVDDVLTTGSTFLEAARVLRSAGVKSIYGIVLAVGK